MARITKFSNVAGCKINSQKSIVFVYTNNKLIRKTMPFIITLRKYKHLGTHLTKQVKDIYNKNYSAI